MAHNTLKSDGCLLLTATIWGFAFVAQRVGMDHVGPFAFNGIRFALGSLCLIPLMILTREDEARVARTVPPSGLGTIVLGGGMAGIALFMGASLQQVGLVYTTAGKAGFITGLYVVIVPILGLFFGQRSSLGNWGGAILAAAGLFLLSVNEALTIAFGDLLEVIGAFFWAGHVLVIGRFSPRINALRLAFVQYSACAVLSLLTALVFETTTLSGIGRAAVPILYGGIASVGIAYTLQVVAQKSAHPAHAAVLLSLESVFAALGGWLLLGETLSTRGLVGCGLMFCGMLLSQLWGMMRKK
ncbi:MAG: DMT family transporter [Desulfobacterales bacterium]|nr:DMT family transporter [Desulfobacterales bacterium]